MDDSNAVETVELCALVREFATKWRKTRPSLRGQFATPDPSRVDPLGPYAALAAWSGVPESRISAIAQPANAARHPRTSFAVADALVSAIGCPEAFHDGRITVR